MENLNVKDSSFKYSGKVKVELMKGRDPYKTIEIHNNGSNEFFRILCNSIAGSDMGYLMPKYLRMFNNENKQITLIANFYNKVEVVSSNSEYSTVFTFIIPGTYLKNGETIKKMILYNSSATDATALATIELDTSVTELVSDSSSNMMIQWQMSFSN